MFLSKLLNRLRTKLPWYIPLNTPVQAYSPRRRLKNMLRRNMKRNSGRQWVRLRKAMNKKGLSINDIPKVAVR